MLLLLMCFDVSLHVICDMRYLIFDVRIIIIVVIVALSFLLCCIVFQRMKKEQ
jgi:hypothetical protein